MMYSVQNPGHCLHDVIFPIGLDRYQRNQDSASSTDGERPFFYPGLLYLPARGTQLTSRLHEKDWCRDMLNYSGLADARQALAIEPTLLERKSDATICFRRLLLPRLGVLRFPIDNTDTETMRVIRNNPQQESFILRDVDRPPFTDSYPAAALNDLRKQALKGLNLISEPWPESDLNTGSTKDLATRDTTRRYLRVFLYDRQEAPRRKWTNSLDVIPCHYHSRRPKTLGTNDTERTGVSSELVCSDFNSTWWP